MDKETQPKKIVDSNVIDHFVDVYTSMATSAFELAHIKDNWKERSISVPNPGKRAYDFNFTEQSKEEVMTLAYEGVLQNLLYYTKYKHFPVGNLKCWLFTINLMVHFADVTRISVIWISVTGKIIALAKSCLLYTSDAADE